MTRRLIDLRSDTVTKPSAAMRKAIAEAEVGDDVYREDPTVIALERRVAELVGKEAAIFTPTGTMANQIAIGAHAEAGDELLCDPTSHVYVWEGGGIARLWGVTTRGVEPAGSLLHVDDLTGKIRPDDAHYARTRLVCLENTHNRRGGKVHAYDDIARISKWARSNALAMHLDGARLMNAVVATRIHASQWGSLFDSVSICFSKGLGAPAGSALAGTADLIKRAHRLRKLLGGGMRQAGVLAAAALHALEHNVDRLADDHANAKILAEAVENTDGLRLESGAVETNLVWIEIDRSFGTASAIAAKLRERGVLVSALGPQTLRACTHLDCTRGDAERAAEVIRGLGG